MCGRLDFLDLPDSRFVVIVPHGFPGLATEKVRIVQSGIVVAPVSDMLDRSRAGHRGFEARGLRDQPVSHVTTVAIAADSKMVRVGDAILYQRIDAFENIPARLRYDLRNDIQRELIAIADR